MKLECLSLAGQHNNSLQRDASTASFSSSVLKLRLDADRAQQLKRSVSRLPVPNLRKLIGFEREVMTYD